MAKIVFPIVSLKITRSGECPKCKKRATRTHTFWQTINPYNISLKTNKPKTRDEILEELRNESLRWDDYEVWHQKCERKD